MKKIILSLLSVIFMMSSCKVNQHQPVSDDLYADPVAEKRLARIKAEQDFKKQQEEQASRDAAYAAQKAKEDANPYYQDPQYNDEDYYDYAYASRFRRFHNPVNGAGYYDNYYTNSYWYNNNPHFYGTSIYSTYNWWTPSNQFGMYYGNGWNNPYCFNNGWNNGWNNGMGYNGWGNPYGMYQPMGYSYWNNPWNNPYYGGGYFGNNWGYYNSFDLNSNYTYAPRQGNAGSNSTRGSYGGMTVPKELTGERQAFFNTITDKQEKTERFTNYGRKNNLTNTESFNGNSFGETNSTGRQSIIQNNENGGGNSNNNPTRSSGLSENNSNSGGGRQVNNAMTEKNGGQNNGPVIKNQGGETIKNNSGRNQSSGKSINENSSPSFNNNSSPNIMNRGGGGSSGGGSMSPRNSGGGSVKPR